MCKGGAGGEGHARREEEEEEEVNTNFFFFFLSYLAYNEMGCRKRKNKKSARTSVNHVVVVGVRHSDDTHDVRHLVRSHVLHGLGVGVVLMHGDVAG